ncbi:hypothetical protein H8356DRAFT_540543 [Neocallimastix lanati (nom. inval.)]|jgi:diazepam-binding inhibitor (GABA receptor modulating acyl-CoA-binding protein)|uniref:ACB domain-containing protein n=1 Tax=Neocallimastix californiae TaxID=1754190 RepID=A0A1Y2ETC2_9FUNG|nr:hypothetical protein H8356DRAFT_540543 [Neocallimastix sp. JGI-2020a]ORY74416.1 hypothetical protein LY90DRAFT_699273 [Neocallimastix californiae]|eukprot:ORY74416.1 hypothetical protein LY90DRAFT_699273 [Neocallimastix californiae]
MLSETDKKFAEAVHIFQNLPQELRPTQEEELEFYGLYKRAVVGKCDISKPNFDNILGLAKWESWKKLDSLSMVKAREIYVDQLIKLLERFPDRPDVVELLDTFTKLHLNENDDGISEKSAVKANTIPSNTSDSINNEYQMDNSHVEYSSRDINTNQSNSLNMNTSMNSSINITSPRLSRNNSNQYNPEELININTNNNNRQVRSRSRTDGSIYQALPADISLNLMHSEDPSSLRSETFLNSSMTNPSLNPKSTPLNPSMSPLPNMSTPNMNPSIGMGMGMNMGMGMGMGMNGLNGLNNINGSNKLPPTTPMSIVMLTRLRDLEIEVNSLNTRLNMLTNMIKNNTKNSLQNWLKFILKTFGANVVILLFMIIILGPNGFNKLISQFPAWLLKLQSRYIANSKPGSSGALTHV